MKTNESILVEARDKAADFIKSLKSDIDLIYHIDFEEIDLMEPENVYDAIREQLEDAQAFDEEVIYYSRAIELLKEYDPSFRNSLGLAADMGFELKNLSSETLATLLASDINREDFSYLESDITNFFTELAEWIESENAEIEETEEN